MKFSTRAEYGLRAIIHLDPKAKKSVSLAKIANLEKLSLSYLERLFSAFRKAGIVRADLGVSGGYYLTRPAGKINVFEVIEAVEGSLAPFSCVDEKKKGCSVCHCRISPIWGKLYKQIKHTLSSMKLNELMK